MLSVHTHLFKGADNELIQILNIKARKAQNF